MAKNKNQHQIADDTTSIQETSQHPVVQEVDRIGNLLEKNADEKTIAEAVKAYSDNLTKPGFLEQAREGEVVLARRRITKLLKAHRQSKKGKLIKADFERAKKELGKKIGIIETEESSPEESEKITPIQPADVKPEISKLETLRPLEKMGPGGISKFIKRIENELEKQKKMNASEATIASLEKQLKETREYFQKRYETPEEILKGVQASVAEKQNQPQVQPEAKPAEVKKPLTQKDLDTKLEQMADKNARKEYRKFTQLYRLLSFEFLPKDDISRKRVLDNRKNILNVKNEGEYRELRDQLLNTALKPLIKAKNPIDAIRAVFGTETLDENNIAQKLREKIEAIEAGISEAKTEIKKKQPDKNAKQKPAPAQIPKATPPATPTPVAISVPPPTTAPEKAATEPVLKKWIEKAPDKEKVFLEAVQKYIQNKPNEQKLFLQALQFLEIDPKGDPELEKLQKNIKRVIDASHNVIDEKTNTIPEDQIKSYFDNHLKKLKKEIEKILNKVQAGAQVAEHTAGPANPAASPAISSVLPGTPSASQVIFQSTTGGPQLAAQWPESTLRQTLENLDGSGAKTPGTVGEVHDLTNPKKPKSAESAEKTKTINEMVFSMMKSLLYKPELVQADSPVCMAIVNRIKKENEELAKKGEKFDMTALERFLKNPDFEGKTVNYTWIIEEMKKPDGTSEKAITIDELKGLKQAKIDEKNELENNLKGMAGKMKTNDEDIKKTNKRITALIQLDRQIAAAIGVKGRSMQYESPREILGIVNVFLNKDKEISVETLAEEINNQVETEKEALFKGGARRVLNKALYFLRPSLGSTLKALAKDKKFAKLGEKPEEVLAKLAKIGGKTTSKVKKWVEELPGGLEQNANTTVPRLIAYLELAIREGKVSSILNTDAARDLVKSLREVQREVIRLELKKQFEGNTDMTNQQKMMAYIRRLNDSEQQINDIDRNIIRNNVLKHYAGGAVVAGGLIAAPFLAPLAALPAAIASPALLIKSYLSKTSDKNKNIMRRGAGSVAIANALCAAGALVSLPVALAGLALGGVMGAFSPELWKNRKGIANGMGKGAKGTYKYGVKPLAKLTWGTLKFGAKTTLWTLKYVSPLGIYYIPKYIASRRR